MPQPSPPTVKKIAYQILAGFDKCFRWHSRITRGAQQRFEQGQWQQVQLAVKERIGIYGTSLNAVVSELYQQVSPHQQDADFWHQLKAQYLKLLDQHAQFELAETFYNSVIGRIFKHTRIDNNYMFMLPSRCFLPGQDLDKILNRFDANCTIESLIDAVFNTYHFNIDFADQQLDRSNIAKALRERFTRQQLAEVQQVEILKPVFYRSKAAYLVGRMCMPGGDQPFVLALMRDEQQTLYVDALLTERQDLSVIFGFARSYFMADSQYPGEIVAFLHALLPNKKHFELYIALGLYKHGKTVFYRNFLQHLQHSEDQFEVAPGTPGLVMAVFHLPSHGVVFKIIKDEFAESKKITREHVKDCYRLVKTSDRVGRMADTHEYMNFRLPLARIAPALLSELQQVAAGSIEISGDELIIKHLYIERKMTPLNLYLQQEQSPQKIERALDELGLCIKQIAAANIFPGDMLHKNFGITRHGRVIFYDYDEICLMHQRTFRDLPTSDDPFAMDTLSVSPEDVFPEQFEHFIVGKRSFKEILKRLHPELMQPSYWRQLQQQCQQGQTQHFTPYHYSKRFKNQPCKLKAV